MTKFKLSGKFNIFAIISLAVIVIGMAMGTVFHFVGNGFFSYGGEYTSYKSLTVYYYDIELGGDGHDTIAEICDSAVSEAGLAAFEKTFDNSENGNGKLVYGFYDSVAEEQLLSVKDKINEGIAKAVTVTDIPQSYAEYADHNTILGGTRALVMATVAIAAALAAHFIYVVIRFGLTALCAVFATDFNNLALLAALAAICRVPVTSSLIVVAALAFIVTVIGSTLTLERIRRNRKDTDNAKLSTGEIADLSASQTFKANLSVCAFLAIVAVLAIVAAIISSAAVTPLLSAGYCSLLAFAACCYGNTMFLPACYPVADGYVSKLTLKPSSKKGN